MKFIRGKFYELRLYRTIIQLLLKVATYTTFRITKLYLLDQNIILQHN